MRLLFLISFCLLSESYVLGIDDKIAALKPQADAAFAQLDSRLIVDKEDVMHQLKVMYDLDQTIRKACAKDYENPKILSFFHEIGLRNITYLKKIIEKYGWIRISDFGKDASNWAWLLVQHADFDQKFQQSCLKDMEELLPTKDIDPQNYAYLYDRVALKSSQMGMRQKYGTQATKKDGIWELQPFEGTLEDVNRCRRDVGLGTVEEYLQMMGQIYES